MAKRADEGTFWDHLEVARGVLIRSVIYVIIATTVAWIYRHQLFGLLQAPALLAVQRVGISDFAFRIFDPAGGFTLLMQVSLVTGLLLSAPAWLTELVLFISPGLHPHERRAAFTLIPFAVLLFLSGAAFCYLISPSVFAFLFGITRSINVDVELNLITYLYFLLRLLIVFGLVFEMPLVIMFLVRFGIVSSRALLARWRHAIVIIAIVAAIATPTPDWYTMTLMAGPMVLLYFLSIGLGRMVERRRDAGGAGMDELDRPQ